MKVQEEKLIMETPASVLAHLGLRVVLVMAMAFPMLILYAIGVLGPVLVHDLGIAPGVLGYVSMTTFALAALLSPWAGVLVVRMGTRRGIFLLFLCVALAYFFILTLPGFLGLLVATAFCGISQALCNPVTNVLIAQQVAPQSKASVLGLKQAGVQMAALFAGSALPAMAAFLGWRNAFGILIPCALLLAISAPLIAPSRANAVQTSKGLSLTRPNKLLRGLMLIQLCAGISLSTFVTFMPLFAVAQNVTTSQAATLVALFGAMGIVSRIVLTPLSARLRDESLMLLMLLVVSVLSIGVTMQSSPANTWCLWVGAAGLGLSAVATNAVAMGMLLRDGAFGTPATASGWLSAAFFGGFALGPPVFGALIDSSFGFVTAWRVLIVILLCACVAVFALSYQRRQVGV